MADDPTRMFTHGETYAMVDQAVARETAAAQARIGELEAENTALGTKVDTLETEKAQALQRAEAAEQALTDYRAEVEADKARELKRGERLEQVAQANPHLDLKDDKRVTRIVAMSDEEFEGYLADMRQVASAAPTSPDPAPGDPPRQSAALQSTTDQGEPKEASVRGLFDAARQSRKGA